MGERETPGVVKAWVPESWPCGHYLIVNGRRCQGRMRPARVDYNYDGVIVYAMPCRKCDGCGRLSLSDRSFRAMDAAARKAKPAKKTANDEWVSAQRARSAVRGGTKLPAKKKGRK